MTEVILYLMKKFVEVMIVSAIVEQVIQLKINLKLEPEKLDMDDYTKLITCGDITTDENEIRKLVNGFARQKKEIEDKEHEINLYRLAFYLKDLGYTVKLAKIKQDGEKYVWAFCSDKIAEADSADTLLGAQRLLENAYDSPIKDYVFRLKIIETDLGVRWMEI